MRGASGQILEMISGSGKDEAKVHGSVLQNRGRLLQGHSYGCQSFQGDARRQKWELSVNILGRFQGASYRSQKGAKESKMRTARHNQRAVTVS